MNIKYGEGIVSLYSAAWTIIECKLVISRNDYNRISQLITMGHMSNDNQRYIRELLDRVDDDMIDRLFKD